MIEARSTLIRAAGGRVRVLRATFAHGRCWALRYTVPVGTPMCRMCGCTDAIGCVGGCAWVTARRDLCSRCLERRLLP